MLCELDRSAAYREAEQKFIFNLKLVISFIFFSLVQGEKILREGTT